MKDYFPSVLQWQAVYLENPFIYWDEQQSGRLFKMRRRTHIVGIFPNDEKCIYTTLRAPPSLRCGPGSILRATALRNDAFASQNQAPLAGLGLPGHDPWRFCNASFPNSFVFPFFVWKYNLLSASAAIQLPILRLKAIKTPLYMPIGIPA